MTLTEMKDLLYRWFKAAECGGLVLPDGWFGRPYDNFFNLRAVELDADSLTIHLGGDVSLRLVNPSHACVEYSELVFEGFDDLWFRWREVGGTEFHEELYGTGQLRLVPPVGTAVRLDC